MTHLELLLRRAVPVADNGQDTTELLIAASLISVRHLGVVGDVLLKSDRERRAPHERVGRPGAI